MRNETSNHLFGKVLESKHNLEKRIKEQKNKNIESVVNKHRYILNYSINFDKVKILDFKNYL